MPVRDYHYDRMTVAKLRAALAEAESELLAPPRGTTVERTRLRIERLRSELQRRDVAVEAA